jgi:hypothetical protein
MEQQVMNAFHRGHAITGLEEIAMVVCMHLVLKVSFPESDALNHWDGEISGFMKTLRRWDKGKKGARNYTPDIVFFALGSILNDENERELIEGHIEAKGLDPERINWNEATKAAVDFSKSVCA